MKNVTISLSEDLVHILGSICKDCNLSRYAFAKVALLEKIERHTKNDQAETKLYMLDQESPGKANNSRSQKKTSMHACAGTERRIEYGLQRELESSN